MKLKILILSLFIFNFGFSQDIKETIIYGKVSNSFFTNYDRIDIRTNYFGFENPEISTYGFLNDKREYKIKFFIDRPSELFIFNQFIFVSPADSVNLNFEGQENKLTTDAKNNGDFLLYNFFHNCPRIIKNKNDYGDDFEKYKNDVFADTKFRKRKIDSLEKYWNFSKEFIESIKKIEYYRKAAHLLRFINHYRLSGFDDLIQLKYEDFKNDEFVFFRDYQWAAISYLQYVSDIKQGYLTDVELKKIDQKLSNFSGLTQQYLILSTFNSMEIGGTASSDFIDYFYKKWSDKVSNPFLKSQFVEIYLTLNLRTFNSEVLNQKMIDKNLLPTIFGKEIEKLKGKYVYIDFWATWCGPCVKSIPSTLKIKYELKDRLAVMFISFDKTSKDWKNFQYDLGDNSYWVSGFEDSYLAKNLKIDGIPRYIMLDKDGKLIKAFAPSPEKSDFINGITLQGR